MADSAAGTLGPINWGSNVVNGQLVPQAPTSAYFPLTMGHQYVNPKWPTTSAYGVPPTIPSPAIAPGMAAPQSSVAPTQAGNMSGGASAWHPTKGTLVFGFFALVAGIFMLNYVHYGNGKKK
jgi:hypothetical protein